MPILRPLLHGFKVGARLAARPLRSALYMLTVAAMAACMTQPRRVEAGMNDGIKAIYRAFGGSVDGTGATDGQGIVFDSSTGTWSAGNVGIADGTATNQTTAWDGDSWEPADVLNLNSVADPGEPAADTVRTWSQTGAAEALAVATASGTFYVDPRSDGAYFSTSSPGAVDAVIGGAKFLAQNNASFGTTGIHLPEITDPGEPGANAFRMWAEDNEQLAWATQDGTGYWGITGDGALDFNGTITATNWGSSIAAITTLYNVDLNTSQVRTISIDGSTSDIDGLGTNIIQVDTTSLSATVSKGMVIEISESGSSQLDLAFSSSWKWLTTPPTSLVADGVGVLTLTSFGSAQTDILASWTVTQ